MSAVALCAVVGAVSAAEGAVVSTTGNILKVDPPSTVQLHANESNEHAIVFDERQNITDTGAKFDVSPVVGVYDEPSDLNGSFLPVGTPFSSHLIHADPVFGIVEVIGTVTFEHKILGVAVYYTRLSTSDSAGLPGTLYPDYVGDSRRGLDFGDDVNLDSVEILPDGFSLGIKITASNAMDQIRVFTAVPEPSAAALLGLGSLGLLRRQRR